MAKQSKFGAIRNSGACLVSFTFGVNTMQRGLLNSLSSSKKIPQLKLVVRVLRHIRPNVRAEASIGKQGRICLLAAAVRFRSRQNVLEAAATFLGLPLPVEVFPSPSSRVDKGMRCCEEDIIDQWQAVN